MEEFFCPCLKFPDTINYLRKFAFPVQLAILSEPNESLFKLYGKKIPQCIQMKPTDCNYLNKYTRNGFFLLLHVNRTHFIGEIEDIEFLGDEIPLSVNSLISL